MPQDAQITFNPGTLPEGFCPQSEQQRFNTYISHLSGILPGTFSTFVVSASQPSVDQQSYPWIKVNADGSIVGIYTFANGAWVRPHPIPPGPNGARMLWADTLGNLATFEGGDAGAITSTTGAFWELDSDWTDKLPRGAGTVAVNTNANELSSGVSATDQVRGVYFVKRTARVYFVA